MCRILCFDTFFAHEHSEEQKEESIKKEKPARFKSHQRKKNETTALNHIDTQRERETESEPEMDKKEREKNAREKRFSNCIKTL